MNLGNSRSIGEQPQGYYALLVDNSVRVANELPIFKLRAEDSV